MNKIWLGVALAAVLAFAAPAEAQTVPVFGVTTCGTPPTTIANGKPAYLTVLAGSGVLCSNASGGGGGGTVTQGPTGTNAAAWWVQIGDTARGPAKVQAGNSASVADVALTVADPNAVAAINSPSSAIAGTAPSTQSAVLTGATSKIQTDLNGNIYLSPQSVSIGTLGAPSANYTSIQGGYFYNVSSSVLTRIANTTTYAANETVCLFTSATACAPVTISIAGANKGQGIINRLSLLKSGSTTANATFTIWLFSAAPGTATPSQFDATSYTGPRAADMPNYIGNAQCTSPVVTSDSTTQVWYDCTLSNPNTSGAIVFQALSGATTIDALISVTAAYVPASGETFQVFASGLY